MQFWFFWNEINICRWKEKWYGDYQRQTGPEILRRYWYWYFLWPWTETDTDTDTQTWSTSRPILILIPWKCTGTDTDTDTLLNKNSAKTLQKMLRPLDRYRYWYRDSRNHWIETDTDTSCIGIGTFDTIPIFPSVSGILFSWIIRIPPALSRYWFVSKIPFPLPKVE